MAHRWWRQKWIGQYVVAPWEMLGRTTIFAKIEVSYPMKTVEWYECWDELEGLRNAMDGRWRWTAGGICWKEDLQTMHLKRHARYNAQLRCLLNFGSKQYTRYNAQLRWLFFFEAEQYARCNSQLRWLFHFGTNQYTRCNTQLRCVSIFKPERFVVGIHSYGDRLILDLKNM